MPPAAESGSPSRPAAALGIVAGGGRLPGLLAAACRAEGRPHFLLGIEGQADPGACGREPDGWFRLGAPGDAFAILREAGVGEVVLAGGVRRPSLAELRPDATALRVLARAAVGGLGDDGLLRALVGEIESEGFRVVGADDLVAGLLAPGGTMGRVEPGEQDLLDIARGEAVARALGAVDVGQGVVVQQGIVLAVEAAEGTSEMLRRAGGLRRAGSGGVLVKCAKPGQERRVDLPTVGPETVLLAAEAGLAGIAVEAGNVLVVDRPALVGEADERGLFVVGRPSGG